MLQGHKGSYGRGGRVNFRRGSFDLKRVALVRF